jgi:hypothetical protein
LKIRLRARTSHFILAVILLLSSLTAACGRLETAGDERVNRQTAEAIDGIAAQTLEALRSGVEDPPTLETSEAAIVATLPPTQTPLPTSTPWPAPVRVQVSIDTNCRSGPGNQYPMIGALMVGETTVVRARVEGLDYWIVENPDNPGRECWLWGRHATLDGDTDHLPVANVPVTPTLEPASMAGWAFFDADRNGERGDPGDSPLQGIRLTVRVGNCPGGTSVATIETNVQGRYIFSGLIPTLYCLAHESDQPLFPGTWTILLSPGQTRDDLNFRQLP